MVFHIVQSENFFVVFDHGLSIVVKQKHTLCISHKKSREDISIFAMQNIGPAIASAKIKRSLSHSVHEFNIRSERRLYIQITNQSKEFSIECAQRRPTSAMPKPRFLCEPAISRSVWWWRFDGGWLCFRGDVGDVAL